MRGANNGLGQPYRTQPRTMRVEAQQARRQGSATVDANTVTVMCSRKRATDIAVKLQRLLYVKRLRDFKDDYEHVISLASHYQSVTGSLAICRPACFVREEIRHSLNQTNSQPHLPSPFHESAALSYRLQSCITSFGCLLVLEKGDSSMDSLQCLSWKTIPFGLRLRSRLCPSFQNFSYGPQFRPLDDSLA